MNIPSSSTARSQSALAAAVMIAVCLTVLTAQGCRSTPISGRKQLVLIPESEEIQLGVQAYEETLSKETLSTDTEMNAMVERVGRRIAAVADKPEYDWEFHVIARKDQNAFALPGGKVAVYEGILPVCQSEAGLAVVMSHEIAHAIARHGGERMSEQAVVSGVGSVINAVSQKRTDQATTQKIMQVYGVTSQYGVVLPYSRKHESEADAIGLILMAKAGYDPSVAPEFWERFSTASGTKPPEWASTHPADARRAADLRALLPEAMKYYQAAGQQYGLGEALPIGHLTTEPGDDANAVQQTSNEQAAFPQTFGSISALTSRYSAKKGTVRHAHYTEPATGAASGIQTASAEVVTSGGSSDFLLPVKSDGQTPADVPQVDGWEASRGNAPSADVNPFAQ